ncbi:uncharacterized protein LOC123689510 [Pieris rapae]|uniref:uncharacterized protein LOC123689510 n=1 Tax=Pieris rapae TaxID=64459 RepID=UPI001E28179C|nr:uncharacterized protein LOC123689510 [Pieris rapae]
MVSLERRRWVSDLCTLHKIANGSSDTCLLERLEIKVPTRSVRIQELFVIPMTDNNVSQNAPLILSGHGCFGSYLHRVVGCEEAPTCHHCVGDSPDDAQHTLRDCPAWDVERGPLLDALQGEDATLPNVLKVLVSARNDGPWKIFYNFCEAVMKIKEEAERTRELCPDAHPRRRRKPQARRINARRAHQILAA